MYSDWFDYLITLIISFIPMIIYWLCDKYYALFNSGKEKYQIENTAPKIFFCTVDEIAKNDIQSTILSLDIECVRTSVDDKIQERESSILKFSELSNISDANVKINYGIRLYNQTNDGLSFDEFHSKNNEVMPFINCPFRHIDPSKSLIIVFALRDRPNQIVAKFKDYKLTYSIDATTTGYISPKIKKLKKTNLFIRNT